MISGLVTVSLLLSPQLRQLLVGTLEFIAQFVYLAFVVARIIGISIIQ